MEVKKTKEGSVTILQPIGRIDSNTATDLENALLNLLENQENKIVINLDSSYLTLMKSLPILMPMMIPVSIANSIKKLTLGQKLFSACPLLREKEN